MIKNLIVVSDLHCGCKMGLCPPVVSLDDGGEYRASRLQLKVWSWWEEFWEQWVPEVTHGEKYSVVINGDAIDGVHHNSVTQISNNITDQLRIARSALEPIAKKCKGRFYVVRGTEAHVGQSGQDEEKLAEMLGAVQDKEGAFSRYEVWIRIGKALAHVMHHIGTTGRTHYETSAVMAELGEEYVQAGRWKMEPPDVVVRSHRHRCIEVKLPTYLGYGYSFTTAGWQLKTPFTYRIPGGRVTTPQIGGSLIRMGDKDLYTRHRIWNIERTQTVE
jgi:hypothetical protein